jgi:hypothetical protein
MIYAELRVLLFHNLGVTARKSKHWVFFTAYLGFELVGFIPIPGSLVGNVLDPRHPIALLPVGACPLRGIAGHSHVKQVPGSVKVTVNIWMHVCGRSIMKNPVIARNVFVVIHLDESLYCFPKVGAHAARSRLAK